MRRVAVLGLLAAAVPEPVWACTWCVGSAFGDRSFNWPYLSLIVAPFVVAAIVAGVLAYHHGVGPFAGGPRASSVRSGRRLFPRTLLGGGIGRGAPPPAEDFDKERT